MNEIWANRLIAGTQTWDKCVKTGRADAVKAVLKNRVEIGAITSEKYTELTRENYSM